MCCLRAAQVTWTGWKPRLLIHSLVRIFMLVLVPLKNSPCTIKSMFVLWKYSCRCSSQKTCGFLQVLPEGECCRRNRKKISRPDKQTSYSALVRGCVNMHLCTHIHKHTYSQNEPLRVHRQNMSVSCCWVGLKGESSIKLFFLYRNIYPKRSVKTVIWKIPSCFIPHHFCVESWTLKYTDLTWVLWSTCHLFVLGMCPPYHKACL